MSLVALPHGNRGVHDPSPARRSFSQPDLFSPKARVITRSGSGTHLSPSPRHPAFPNSALGGNDVALARRPVGSPSYLTANGQPLLQVLPHFQVGFSDHDGRRVLLNHPVILSPPGNGKRVDGLPSLTEEAGFSDGDADGSSVNASHVAPSHTGVDMDALDDIDDRLNSSASTPAKTDGVCHRLFAILSSNWKKIAIAAFVLLGGVFVARRVQRCENGVVTSSLPLLGQFGFSCPVPSKVEPLTDQDFLDTLSPDELVAELKRRAETSPQTKEINDKVKERIEAGRVHAAEEKRKSEDLKKTSLPTFDQLSPDEQEEIACLAKQSLYRSMGSTYLLHNPPPPEDCKNPSTKAAKAVCPKEDEENEKLDKASLKELAVLDRATKAVLNPACSTHATIILGNSDTFKIRTPNSKVPDDVYQAQCNETRKAFRKLSLEVHPDKARDEERAKKTQAFAALSNAFQTLCAGTV